MENEKKEQVVENNQQETSTLPEVNNVTESTDKPMEVTEEQVEPQKEEQSREESNGDDDTAQDMHNTSTEVDSQKKEEESTEEVEPPLAEVVGEKRDEEPEPVQPEEVSEAPDQKELEVLRRKVDEYEEAKKFETKKKVVFSEVARINNEFEDFCTQLAGSLEQEFKKYGIDTSKSFKDIQAEDPGKAQMATNLVDQAMKLKKEAEKIAKQMTTDKMADLMFDRASNKFATYNLTSDQAKVACNTFVDIFTNIGIGDLEQQLDKAIEMSVAHSLFKAPSSEYNEAPDVKKQEQKEVSDPAQPSNSNVVESANVESNNENRQDKVSTEPVAESNAAEVNSNVVVQEEPVDVNSFEQGVTSQQSNKTNADGVTKDNVIEKYLTTPNRERAAFYKKYYRLFE